MALSAFDQTEAMPTSTDLEAVPGLAVRTWEHLVRTVDETPRDGEGTGFRIAVRSMEDCRGTEVPFEVKTS